MFMFVGNKKLNTVITQNEQTLHLLKAGDEGAFDTNNIIGGFAPSHLNM